MNRLFVNTRRSEALIELSAGMDDSAQLAGLLEAIGDLGIRAVRFGIASDAQLVPRTAESDPTSGGSPA